MNLPLETPEATHPARSLAAALGVAESALGDAMLAWVEGSECLLSVKEVASGRHVHVNWRFAAFWGREVADVLGATDPDLMGSAASALLLAADQAVIAQGSPRVNEHGIERDGAVHEFSIFRCLLAAADGGAPRHLCSIWTDLTASRHADERLQRALKHIESQQSESQASQGERAGLRDPETGLYAIAKFDDLLRREVDLSSREHREFALAAIALDPFSEPVHAQGPAARSHAVGVLGALLRGNTRAMDASCQIDEDRFVVLLSGVGLATAHWRMEGLRRQCAAHIIVVDGQELGFRVSMGVASFPHTATTQDALTQACEMALTEARSRGGDQVRLASIRFDAAPDVANGAQPATPL